MPHYIYHRINKIQDLASIPSDCGVEIDLRTDVHKANSIHLSHDAWVKGDDFSAWLDHFQRLGIVGTLILNTKEDGLEELIFSLMLKRGINNFLFLDTAMPTLVHWAKRGLARHFFLRLSKMEALEALLPFCGKVEWLWVDCFDGEPLPPKFVEEAKKNFKICLVSPELQHQPLGKIKDFKNLYALADAICTKAPNEWQQAFR